VSLLLFVGWEKEGKMIGGGKRGRGGGGGWEGKKKKVFEFVNSN
jgi:hypothetical protein